MATTNHLGLTLVEQSQAQKEVTVNQALTRLDAVLNTGAKSRTTNTPPGSPASGDLYIVGGSPTGAWSGQAGKLAYYDQIWRFITPNEGVTLWVNDEDLLYTYNGSAWLANPAVKVKQALWIPAAQMRPSVSGGCAALAVVATSANRPDLVTLDFDASAAEHAQFFAALPKGWDEGTVTAQFFWSHASTSTNFAACWGIQGVAVSDDDLQDVAYGTAQEVTDTGGTTNDLYVSAATAAVTIGGTPAEGDMLCFRVYRNATDGADTLAVDARLHGVKLFYNINTLDEA
jgi:hypothetical protein